MLVNGFGIVWNEGLSIYEYLMPEIIKKAVDPCIIDSRGEKTLVHTSTSVEYMLALDSPLD